MSMSNVTSTCNVNVIINVNGDVNVNINVNINVNVNVDVKSMSKYILMIALMVAKHSYPFNHSNHQTHKVSNTQSPAGALFTIPRNKFDPPLHHTSNPFYSLLSTAHEHSKHLIPAQVIILFTSLHHTFILNTPYFNPAHHRFFSTIHHTLILNPPRSSTGHHLFFSTAVMG